jgi:hypothetical protein
MPVTLTRAMRASAGAGEPLPTVFKTLSDNTIYFRKAQQTLIAAAPGVGKSLVSLTVAMRCKVPTYYFSADSDESVMYIRAAAMLTGWSTQDIEHQIRIGNVETIDAKLNGHDHIRFNFDPNPSMDDVDEELQAFAAMYGEYPKLIVMDNVRNVFDPDGEKGTVDGVIDFLNERAKETRACVIGLHHVTGAYDDGITPVPLSGLMGKVSKVPATIITLNRNPQLDYNGAQAMNLSPVKNRGGKADPSGQWQLPLTAYMDTMTLEG